MASMGHVRDLPSSASETPAAVKKESWGTLGVNVEDEYQPVYIVPQDKKKVVRELKSALKDAEELILATDEDREGESIGWHLKELLNPKVPVKRMVFSEITKEAIQAAIENPRDLDENLVEAQEARRVLDRLYGYSLSPLLWKKIGMQNKKRLSAGRVQSVAVRVLVQREFERLAFHSGSYWDLKALLKTPSGEFEAALSTLEGQKIASGKDFDESTGKLKEGSTVRLLSEEDARTLTEKLSKSSWAVSAIENRNQVRKPSPPFTTSTMTQEANRKLSMTTRQCMSVAQRLYEGGFITYMRTDSVNLSQEAITAARNRVTDSYGDDYLSPQPRQFSTQAKGAQEAHEAIRPAGTEMKTGEELGLNGGELKLYELIWKRTMATQMAEARLRFQTVTIVSEDAEFRATGRHVEFPGFFRAYVEGVDDPEAAMDDQENALPALSEQQALELGNLDPLPHETKPPARFTEATLIRELESDGIGRPSTYASIIGTIQDRGYVRKAGSQLCPTFTAMAVTRLLEDYFPRLVDLEFTAKMEQTLDDVAAGDAERVPYLRGFYGGDDGLDQKVKSTEENIDPRKACTLSLDGVDAKVRVGKFGAYLEKEVEGEEETIKASIPPEVAPADFSNEEAERLIEIKQKGPQSIGMHPDGLPVYVRHGPYGYYVQLGDGSDDEKPKRVGIPKSIDPTQMTFEQAVDLLATPRLVGHHPETNKVVKAGVGMYGPYVLHDKVYGNFDKKTHTYDFEGETYDVLTITMDAAVEMLRNTRRRAAPEPLRVIGEHPDDGEQVAIFDGRYGPYVKHGKSRKAIASVPKDTEIEHVSLEQALGWIEEKLMKSGGKVTKKKKKKAKKKKAKKAKKAKKKASKKAAAEN